MESLSQLWNPDGLCCDEPGPTDRTTAMDFVFPGIPERSLCFRRSPDGGIRKRAAKPGCHVVRSGSARPR